MSKVKIQGNASGTGVLTVTAPNTSTDRTITLPDATGTLLTADGDGSSLTGVGVAGITSAADATAISIDSSERVGIGTGSPTARLHVYNANDHVRLSAQCAQNTGQHWQFQSRNNGEFWLRNETTGSNKLIMDSTGAVTMPSQPAFCVLLSGNQNNLALYGRRKVEFDTERFDQNADFNTSTHEFTAPVTGKYSLHFSCEISDYQGDAYFYGWHIETSNEVYLTYEHVGSGASDNSGGGAISVIADMDAGDTAYASIYQHAGGATSDVVYTGTHFSGALIC
jgi:hypothetical protein